MNTIKTLAKAFDTAQILAEAHNTAVQDLKQSNPERFAALEETPITDSDTLDIIRAHSAEENLNDGAQNLIEQYPDIQAEFTDIVSSIKKGLKKQIPSANSGKSENNLSKPEDVAL